MKISFSYQQYLEKLNEKTGYSNLQPRERLLVAGAIVIIFFLVIFHFILNPMLETRKNLTLAVDRKKQELLDMKIMSQDYLSLKTKAGGVRDRLTRRQAGFSLFSFLDRQATKTGVKGQVKYMKPSTIVVDDSLNESVVEIKLEQVTLRQLVDFLKVIEPQEYVVEVKRLSVQESGKEKKYLDAVLQVMTFVLKGSAS